MLRRFAITALLASVGLFACGEHDAAGGTGGGSGTGSYSGISDDCVSIIEACHLKDTGDPGPVNDCHQAAHANKSAQCTAEKAKCVALCDAAPTNMDAGAGGHGHGGAAGHAGAAGNAGGGGQSHGGAGGQAGQDGG